MYTVDILYSNFKEKDIFEKIELVIDEPAITKWFKENDISNVIVNDLWGHNRIQILSNPAATEINETGSQTDIAYIKGKTFTFEKDEDAVLFKFRWGIT